MSMQTAKGSKGERDLLAALIEAGQLKARRVGHQQRIAGPKAPDIDGTEFYAENKDRACIPVAIWRYIEECLENRPPNDTRPVLLRLKRTGKKYPAVMVMLEKDWVAREKSRVVQS